MKEDKFLFEIEKTSKAARLYTQRQFDRLGMGITVEQWNLLKIINESQSLSQKILAAQSLRDPAAITRTLDLLERKYLVDRTEAAEDKRQCNIILTVKAEKFIAKHIPILEKESGKSLKGLTTAEIKELNRVLQKIQDNLA